MPIIVTRQRWSREYLVQMGKFHKWQHPTRNRSPDWRYGRYQRRFRPLARVIDVHPGHDGLVRVATIKTSNGVYKRPINKLALLF